MTIPSSRSLIFKVKSTGSEHAFGRLRTSSGIFGNDRVVFKNPSTPRIKISRLYLRKSWQVYKTNWFPEGPDVKCFVIFLDFHFNSNKRTTRVNQNGWLGTYNNTNFNSQNHWMNDLQTAFLILSASFSSTSCCFSSRNFWDNFKDRCFLAWGFMFVLLCSFTKKKTGRTWQWFSCLLSRHFPPCFDHVL